MRCSAKDSARQLAQYPIEVYGSTETGGIGYRQQQEEQRPWTLFPRMILTATGDGVALQSPHMPDVDAYVLDDDLQLLADSQFILKGRKDRVVKISEKRISLTEMEKFLENLDSIQQCVVLPFMSKRESVACAVVLTERGRALLASEGKRALIESWKTVMRTRFDNVVIPRKWQMLSEIPLNSQSKIDTVRLMAGFVRSNHDGHA
jgi:acyl-coenzyme A synthetase/AMP-(fatty) acid ligase